MYKLGLFISLLAISATCFSQTDTTYQKQWKEMDSLNAMAGLPQSALKKVNELYRQANAKGQQSQVIKALLYRFSLEAQFTEENIDSNMAVFEQEINKTHQPANKALLMSLMAEKYLNYLNQQRWQIYNRTKTVNFKKSEIGTWTVDDLHQAITFWYLQSLKEAAVLQSIRVEKYDAILNEYTKNYYRPTLFDLLAHRALSYFKSDETYITKPAYKFIIDQVQAMGNIETFIDYHFTSKDSASNKWKALMIYQQLLQFHQQQHDTAALIDVNLDRLTYVNQEGVFAKKDSLYLVALYEITTKYNNNRFAAQAWYLIAAYYANKAALYQPNGDTTNRYMYVKAMDIIKSFLPLTDSTEGHYNLYNLHHSILQKSLNINTEQTIIPLLPIKALVIYKNIDTLYYRIIKATDWVKDKVNHLTFYEQGEKETLFHYANKFPFLLQQKILLPATGDYQQHGVEVKIDGLPVGTYYLLSSSSAVFSDKNKLTWQSFTVSNISFINNQANYFVLNRQSGFPIAGAKVVTEERTWNDRARKNVGIKNTYITDKNGYFKHTPSPNFYGQIALSISYGKDSLNSETNSSYNNSDDNDDAESMSVEKYEADQAKAFFFTDRSIYRPGQTVYYKLLALTKDKRTKATKLFTHIGIKDSIYLYLRNVNNEEIDSVFIRLNEYGSFAGQFKLPENVLTGNFTLVVELKNHNSTQNFFVEEYKRPTFYVEIKKPEGTYKLGDSIAATVMAKAYSGSVTDGAKVKYTVTRNGRFMNPWMWWRMPMPRSENTILTTGEATTDDKGNFVVNFKALADEAITKNQMPVFDFTVTADVTDRSGETRSANTTFSVAYQLLTLQLSSAATAEADSSFSLSISTTNIQGDKQSAEVKVSFYPLQSPKQPLKNRYWQQPDLFLYSKEEFSRYFPNDVYRNEDNQFTWAKGVAAYTKIINTKDSTKLTLPKSTLKSGWYVVEATTKDKGGNDIKDAKYVQLFSRKSGQFNSQEYLFTSTIKNSAQVNQPATFLIGTGATDVYVIQEIQRKSKEKNEKNTSEFSYYQLNKNIKTVDITPQENDKDGMGVNFMMVKENRSFTWHQDVNVENENKSLDVEVISYRNKLEPGNNEKWTVKISGNKKEAVAAEVLTSMYDASLDQFKPHGWSTPVLFNDRFNSSVWNINNGFTFTNSQQNELLLSSKWKDKIYPSINTFFENYGRRDRMMLSARVNNEMEGGAPQLADNPYRGNRFQVLKQSNYEIVVTGTKVKKSLSDITNSGAGLSKGTGDPLYVVNGVIVSSISNISQDDIESINILKGAESTALYGSRGADGVIIITTKNGAKKKEETPVKVRTNFNETAFFFPQLNTDKDGNLSFTFTLPESLTQWKWQLLAHDKAARFGYLQRSIVSQKTLMVQMNAPRFIREGDTINLSAKISNLSNEVLNGKATLQLTDAITGEVLDVKLSNLAANQNFTVAANQSTAVQFSIQVPVGITHPVTWKVIAKAGSFSDGEENTIPILSNRMMVTESLPLFVRGNATKNFTFKNLLNSNSSTLQHQSLTIEYTSNPVWYAIQSLPYLMEYPYECSEQTFNRMYANALASTIVRDHPQIKTVFIEWMKDSTALLSNLEKNAELKNILLQETPWVLQAKSESQKKKELSKLFETIKLANDFKKNLEKLKQMQMGSGGFSWFKGGYEDRYMTQYILTGMGRLKKMNAIPTEELDDVDGITNTALKYIDKLMKEDYEKLVEQKIDLKKYGLSQVELQYLYMRSYYNEDAVTDAIPYNYYLTQAKNNWAQQSSYFKAMTGVVLLRKEAAFVTDKIIPSLFENGVMDNDSAMYWKDNFRGYYWYQAPVEQQSLIIELTNEMYKSNNSAEYLSRLNDMKTWLLKQKQTNQWSTTKATADAIYALVSTGNNIVDDNRQINIQAGNYTVSSSNNKTEAGTGYLKQSFEGSKVNKSMGNISISTTGGQANNTTPSWGAVYWQYFEDMDKIPSATETPFVIKKNLFKEVNTATGAELQPVNNNDQLKVGDKIKVRIEIKCDRNMEYIYLKDMRAAGTEPVNVLSSYKYQDGLGYYESTKDASTNFFIGYMPKGTYVFEYPLFVTHAGNFSVGITTAQCMYAPEFSSHSEGIRVKVN